jgi:hypothetical protein
MRGKMVHPSIREYDCSVIWVHADLSAGGMTFVVAHECRHLWQNLTWREEEGDREQRELDANIYALRDAPLPQDLTEVKQRYWKDENR